MKSIMRQCLIGFGVALLIMAMVACQKQETIKIGVIGTMSGANSDLSVSGRRGVELAVEKINQSGGIAGQLIELVVKNDQNTPDIALEEQKAFASEGIQLVVGHFTSGMVIGVIDYVNQQNMLLLGPTISADTLSGKDDHFVRFIASTKEQASALSAYALSKNQKRIMIVFDVRNKGFTDELVNHYKVLMAKDPQNTIEALSYDPSIQEDVSVMVDKIQGANPEALVILTSAEDCAKIAQLIKPQLPAIQLYAPLWANTPELIHKGGQAIDGMIIVGAIDSGAASTEYSTFKADFQGRFGEEPTFASVFAYETMMALALSIQESGSVEPDKVKATLLKLKEFDGLQSSFSIDSYGDNTRSYFLFEINEGIQRKVE